MLSTVSAISPTIRKTYASFSSDDVIILFQANILDGLSPPRSSLNRRFRLWKRYKISIKKIYVFPYIKSSCRRLTRPSLCYVQPSMLWTANEKITLSQMVFYVVWERNEVMGGRVKPNFQNTREAPCTLPAHGPPNCPLIMRELK